MTAPVKVLALYHTLPLGLYRVRWKESAGGGTSLASVGNNEDGSQWIACVNWVSAAPLAKVQDDIEVIETVEKA